MAEKITVALLFGGRSSEHEISCVTATGIMGALDRERFDVLPIGITKDGSYTLLEESELNFKLDPENMPVLQDNGTRVIWPFSAADRTLRVFQNGSLGDPLKIDVVFPVLHGPFGEDGTVQGMLELSDLPYVGSGVLASAACMDKHVAKTMLQAADIKVAPWRTITRDEYETLESFEGLDAGLKYPLFVKPARAGSSVGVSRVTEFSGIEEALKVAFAEDHTVLIEEGIEGREVEIAVLQGSGSKLPETSTVIGEIVFQGKDFYDYEAKYLGSDGIKLVLPAEVSDEDFNAIKKDAIKAFITMQCAGPARIDFFLTEAGPVLNEINTMPGFTPISMYPQLWQKSGLEYSDLVTRLIELALLDRVSDI